MQHERAIGGQAAHRSPSPARSTRPDDKHERDEQSRHDLRQRRREQHRDHALADADDGGRDHRAAQVSEAADDDDDESEQQEFATHQIIGLPDRHNEHASNGRQHGASSENDGIHPAHWHAIGLGNLAIHLRRAHIEADARLGQRPPRQAEQDQRSRNDDELVAGVAEPGELHAEVNRRLDRLGVRPEGHQHHLLRDEEQPHGGNDGAFGIVADAAEYQIVGGDRHAADEERRDDERRPEIQRAARRQPSATSPRRGSRPASPARHGRC